MKERKAVHIVHMTETSRIGLDHYRGDLESGLERVRNLIELADARDIPVISDGFEALTPHGWDTRIMPEIIPSDLKNPLLRDVPGGDSLDLALRVGADRYIVAGYSKYACVLNALSAFLEEGKSVVTSLDLIFDNGNLPKPRELVDFNQTLQRCKVYLNFRKLVQGEFRNDYSALAIS